MNEEDINFLISIQDLEQPEFDNACLERENKRLSKEIEKLNNIINEIRNAFNDKTILNNMMLVRRIKEIIGSDKE